MNSVQLRSLPFLPLLLCTGTATAQKASIAYSPSYSLARGNSDAGATLFANAYAYGSKEHIRGSLYRAYIGEGRANAQARLDAKFLGASRTVARFSGNLRARGSLLLPNSGGFHTSCTQSGNAYLRLGGTTLWNRNFTYELDARRSLTLRIVSPTLTVFAGAPVILSGRLNGSVSTAVDLDAFGCHFRAKFNGHTTASAHGSGSATIIGPIIGGATISFRVDPQSLRANVTAQPGVGTTWTSPYSWLKGRVTYQRGYIGAYIKAWAYIPWKVSTTVASWSLGASTKVLFDR